MSESKLVRATCPTCGKRVGIRPDQLGRRLRCPSCRVSFALDDPTELVPLTELDGAVGPEKAPPESVEWVPAEDANELVRTAPPPPPAPGPRARLGASFRRPRETVYQAAIRAVRDIGAVVVDLDQANGRVRFEMSPHLTGDHDLFVFPDAGGTCDIDIVGRGPDPHGQAEHVYAGIVREMGKYLLFAPEPGRAAPARAALPPHHYDDDDPEPTWRRRRRRRAGPDGLGIAGMVCGIVGVVLFCIPLLGGILGVLGVVFGGVSMARGRGSGFSIAALSLGTVACVLAGIVFLAVLADTARPRW